MQPFFAKPSQKMTLSHKLFTVGHSNRSFAEMVALLHAAKVTAVADVRSQPYSKYLRHFDREQLASTFLEAGIAYVFLGELLGARRHEPECYVDGRASYARIAQTQGFAAGLERLRQGSLKYQIALMCAEREPISCHRTILVARALREEFAITHLIAPGVSELHSALEERLLKHWQLDQEHLFYSKQQCLEEAYTRQAATLEYVAPKLPLTET